MAKGGLRPLATRSLPVVVLAVTAALLAAHYYEVTQLKRKTLASLVLTTQQQTSIELKRLFDPIVSSLSILVNWVQAELPDLQDAALLNSRLVPVMEELPQISGALLADGEGREYLLSRSESGWLTRQREPGDDESQFRWTRWSGPRLPVEEWREATGYDPRMRPWFRGATDSAGKDAVFWTSPYRFFSSKEPGITAARKVRGTKLHRVVGFDVRLTVLSELTRGLSPEAGGRAFILTADGRVIGVPQDEQFRSASMVRASVLTDAGAFPVPLVRDAYEHWMDQGRTADAPFAFSSQGVNWWASFWAYELGEESLWLAVTVPEDALVAHLGRTPYAIPATIVGLGVLLAIASALLIRQSTTGRSSPTALDALIDSVGDDLRHLPQQTLDLIRTGECERLEFKSSLRWNFKAGRTGKEIELAWLKTVAGFMNSKGGVILIGVDDSGAVLGLGKDGFSNEDQTLRHVENLVARHIGSAHFPRVRSRLVTLGEKQVLLIHCEPSPQPVFLKHDKGEDFYIRTGPATRSLAPSEVLAYLEARRPA